MIVINTLLNGLNEIDSKVVEYCKPVGDYLDTHPELYKVCIVSIHFFRAVTMFALMELSPLPAVATFGVMLGLSLGYRAAVERFCIWKFTLPSNVGAVSLWMTKNAIITVVSGAALGSLGSVLAITAGVLSLGAYIGWVIYLSHIDVQSYIDKKNNSDMSDIPDCCRQCPLPV